MAVISGSRAYRPQADGAAPGDAPNERSSLKRTVIPNTARRNRVTGTPLQRGAVAAMGDERSASVETAAAVDVVVVRTLRVACAARCSRCCPRRVQRRAAELCEDGGYDVAPCAVSIRRQRRRAVVAGGVNGIHRVSAYAARRCSEGGVKPAHANEACRSCRTVRRGAPRECRLLRAGGRRSPRQGATRRCARWFSGSIHSMEAMDFDIERAWREMPALVGRPEWQQSLQRSASSQRQPVLSRAGTHRERAAGQGRCAASKLRGSHR